MANAEFIPQSDWIQEVADRAQRPRTQVEKTLTLRGITSSSALAIPRRLVLNKIQFAGKKEGVPERGDFNFEWPLLGPGCWILTSESNLRGKTSVLEVVRWMLRGSSNLQDDVRKWIQNASLDFKIDGSLYRVSVICESDFQGTLSKLDPESSTATTIATFTNEPQFEVAMSEFFMKELSFGTISTWRAMDASSNGTAIAHGWPSMSGVLFIGTNYESLLGEVTPVAGIGFTLMQLYLGVPWIPTYTAARTLKKSFEHAKTSLAAKINEANEVKALRSERLTIDLEQKKETLAKEPSDSETRARLKVVLNEIKLTRMEEREIENKLLYAVKASDEAEQALTEDRRELQMFLDSQAAGQVFRKLNPTVCPRCESKVNDDRRSQEMSDGLCCLCGVKTEVDAELGELEAEMRNSCKASSQAHETAEKARQLLELRLDGIHRRMVDLEQTLEALERVLASFEERRRLEIDIEVLEARLLELRQQDPPDNSISDEEAIVDAIVDFTGQQIHLIQPDLLRMISDQIVVFAQRFGMQNITFAKLMANGNLKLAKGGEDTSYSKLTGGEKLRVKVATILAMLRIAEDRSLGRHPGLLLVDSPGAQEVSDEDLDALYYGLKDCTEQLPHVQIFIAARTTPALLRTFPADRMKLAQGNESLW